MAYLFFPRETFTAEVNGVLNRYLDDRHYTVRDPPDYDALHGEVELWLALELVVVGPVLRGTTRTPPVGEPWSDGTFFSDGMGWVGSPP